MRRYLFLTILVAATVVLVACGSGQPAIAIEDGVLDFGSVVNGDILKRDLILRNDGDASLVIEDVVTSCSCTQASVRPMTIPAGETGVLHVEFDSGAHGPDLTGALIRQVFVNSNDPKRPELEVAFTVTVEARKPAQTAAP